MDKLDEAYRRATDSLGGAPHIVLADMRGLKTLSPTLAAQFGEMIGYARARGVVLCAHVSDQTVARLQIARVARQVSPDDDVTVDVSSHEEAKKLVKEAIVALRTNQSGSLRDAIAI